MCGYYWYRAPGSAADPKAWEIVHVLDDGAIQFLEAKDGGVDKRVKIESVKRGEFVGPLELPA